MDARLKVLAGPPVGVGAGRMGGAMREGWHRLGLKFDQVIALEPEPAPEIITLGQRGLRINPSLDLVAASAIVLAVKPQIAPQVLPTLKRLVRDDTVVISIMAGRTLGLLPQALPARAAGGRAMPHPPAPVAPGPAAAGPQAPGGHRPRET